MKNLKLTKSEIQECQDLFEIFSKDATLLDKKLTDMDRDPATVRMDICTGIDEFYKFYAGDVDAAAIEGKIKENLMGKSPLETYSYLSNLMTAMAHIGSKVFDDKNFSKCMEDHNNIIKAIEMGLITEEDPYIANGVEDMMTIISENIEAFAVLFADHPDMAELQEACLTEETTEVQAIAMNTREASINMAAAIYVMQEEGKLKSLGDTRYTARDIGVMSASVLEIDAAYKSGSVETAKSVFQKASRVAVTLLVATPGIVVGMCILDFIGLLTNFATIWMLVGAAAIGVNLKAHYDILAEKLSPVFAVGGRILNITLDKVRPVYAKVSSWVQNNVVTNAEPVWKKCCIFVRERIIIPAAVVLLKAKDLAVNVAKNVNEKAVVAWEKAKVSARAVVRDAHDMVEAEGIQVEETDVEEEIDMVEEIDVEEDDDTIEEGDVEA